MKKITLSIVCLIALLLTFCGCAKSIIKDDRRLSVVTVQFAEYDFARQVSGGCADVTMLLPPGSESHNYDPTPKDIISIQNADVFICTGGESEQWIQTVLDSSENRDILVIAMTDICEAKEEIITEGMQEDEEEGDSDEIEYDEHVWTSPANALIIIDAIKDSFCLKDPANADCYNENAAGYKAEIEALDEEFKSIRENAKRTEIVFADRFPMRYFADEFNLSYYAAFPGCAEDAEPSAKTVKFLIDKVRDDDIPVIFTIEFSNKAIAYAVKDETGAEILEFHSCHNVTSKQFAEGVTYVSLMKQNLINLKEALN